MRRSELIYWVIGIFLLQFFFAEVMSINAIRPDFIMILVLYIGVTHGRFAGVIAGFIAGFLVDLAGVGSFFWAYIAHLFHYGVFGGVFAWTIS